MNFNAFANPYNPGFKKYMLQLIGGENYKLNERAIEDCAKSLTTEEDYLRVGALMRTVWEQGFNYAVQQNVENLEKMGIKATITYREEKSG